MRIGRREFYEKKKEKKELAFSRIEGE